MKERVNHPYVFALRVSSVFMSSCLLLPSPTARAELMPEPLPPLTDCKRFPPMHVATSARVFNGQYQSWLRARAPLYLDKRDLAQELEAEARASYRAWDTLEDAQDPRLPTDTRLLKLQRLKSLLGDQAYFVGQMPPPVPL